MIPGYAELHCLTNYTFLRGASDPEEIVHRAADLRYSAIAITDECSVAGVVRAHVAAKDAKLKLIIGSALTCTDGLKLVLLAADIRGYERLCELITKARRAAEKGAYRIARDDLGETTGMLAIWIPGPVPGIEDAEWVRDRFTGTAWVGVELHRGADDEARVTTLE